MIYLVWAAVFVVAAILYLQYVYTGLNKYEIKYLKPIPLLGNMLDVITGKQHMAVKTQELYNTFPGERYMFYD